MKCIWFVLGLLCLRSPMLGAEMFPTQSAGMIFAWGANDYGQCNIPMPNVDFVMIAAGDRHGLGLKSDSTIIAWGNNVWGQCIVPDPNCDFVAVSGGALYSLALKSNGTIVAWGFNGRGQCDVPVPNADFVMVAAGAHHGLGLKADGSISAWGSNIYGQCEVPPPNADFVSVAGGAYHSLGLKADGTIVAWGYNYDGRCNVPAPNAEFMAIAAGGYHSLGLKADGTIVAWGRNYDGQCNVPPPNANFAAIAAGGYHSLGLKYDGGIEAWGENDSSQCNIPSPSTGFLAVAASWEYSLGLKSEAPVPTLISFFDARVAGTVTDLTWDIVSDDAVQGFNIYRALGEQSREVVNAAALLSPDLRSYRDTGLKPGSAYEYVLGVVLDYNSELTSQPVSVRIGTPQMKLYQSFPNPFNPSTTISFELPSKSDVNLSIYDVRGRLVRILLNNNVDGGLNTRTWDGHDENGSLVSSGTYFCRLHVGGRTVTQKIVRLR